MSKKKTIQINDHLQLVVEAAKMGENGDPFVRVQSFYSTKADPEDFKPGRAGVSIPFSHRIKVSKALKLIHDDAVENPDDVKVLGNDAKGGNKATKNVKKAPRKPDW